MRAALLVCGLLGVTGCRHSVCDGGALAETLEQTIEVERADPFSLPQPTGGMGHFISFGPPAGCLLRYRTEAGPGLAVALPVGKDDIIAHDLTVYPYERVRATLVDLSSDLRPELVVERSSERGGRHQMHVDVYAMLDSGTITRWAWRLEGAQPPRLRALTWHPAKYRRLDPNDPAAWAQMSASTCVQRQRSPDYMPDAGACMAVLHAVVDGQQIRWHPKNIRMRATW